MSAILDLKTAEALRKHLDRRFSLAEIARKLNSGDVKCAEKMANARQFIDDLDAFISQNTRKEAP